MGKAGDRGSLLKRLDEICIKADLIQVTRRCGIPEFSGDGKYLAHYSVRELTKTLGTREDDAENTFTARLLLLLESRPLVGSAVYQEITGEVIGAYWGEYDEHKSDFMPAFLANDILRLWRTFCVNYEAYTVKEPEEKRAERKLKNYKLKHSRLLTCYSALLYLLAAYGKQNSVSPADAMSMISQTPTERLEWLLKQPELAHAHKTIDSLLKQYELFLETTNAAESELVQVFLNKTASSAHIDAAFGFGDLVFEAIDKIGGGNRLRRLLVV